MNDLVLIEKIVNDNNQQAFAELIGQYQISVRQWLRQIIKEDDALADDLAQETFISCYRSLHQFKHTSRFSTWLYRIAYNTFIDYQRKNNKKWLDFSEQTQSIKPVTGENPIELEYDLQKALKQLDRGESLLIYMYYYQELTHEEIHFVTSLPLGTIKSKLRRSKLKLKRLLSTKPEERMAV